MNDVQQEGGESGLKPNQPFSMCPRHSSKAFLCDLLREKFIVGEDAQRFPSFDIIQWLMLLRTVLELTPIRSTKYTIFLLAL